MEVDEEGDEIDAILAEYEEAVPSAQEVPADPQDEAPEPLENAIQFDGDPRQPTPARDVLRQLVESGSIDVNTCMTLERAVNGQAAITPAAEKLQAVAAQYHSRLDQLDVDAKLNEISGETGIAAAEVRRWMMAEVASNAKLRNAWEARYDGEAGAEAAQKAVDRAVKAMQADLARRPDPEATEGRMAMTAALRAASGRPAPEDEGAFARRLQNMDDQEFDAYVQGLD